MVTLEEFGAARGRRTAGQGGPGIRLDDASHRDGRGQFAQDPRPRRAVAAQGQTQLGADLLVGDRRLGDEHRQEGAVRIAQLGESVAHCGAPLVGQHPLLGVGVLVHDDRARPVRKVRGALAGHQSTSHYWEYRSWPSLRVEPERSSNKARSPSRHRSRHNAVAASAGLVPGFPARRAFRVCGARLRSGFLPGARHRGRDMAAHGFFQHQAFLHARVPRTRCPEHGVHLVAVAWARPESGFTLLFEALLIEFATAMPVARVAAMAREHDTRIWRVLEYHVAVQREKLSFADVRRVGMDETSARKGQDYVSTFMDLDARRVLFAAEGRDSATVAAFAEDLTGHGGDPERISDTSSDMSQAFIAGIGEHLPNAKLTYDRYHVIAKLNEA